MAQVRMPFGDSAAKKLHKALHTTAIAALSLNILATGLPALIASYNDAQERIPHALASSTQASGLPAADTLPAGGKVSKLPDTVNAKLADDLATARKGKQDLRHVKTLDTDRSANTSPMAHRKR